MPTHGGPERFCVLAVGVVLLSSATLHAQTDQDVLDRPLTEVWRGQPFDARSTDAAGMISRIAGAAGLRVGIELYPGYRWEPPAPSPPEWIPVDHLTVREALDIAVMRDPGYRWMEVDGIIVLRPGFMWEAPSDHVLHREIGPMTLVDATAKEALDAVLETLTGDPGENSVGGRPGRVTVAFGRTTVLDALNKIAAAHGELNWQFQYQPRGWGRGQRWFSLGFRGGRRGHTHIIPVSRLLK